MSELTQNPACENGQQVPTEELLPLVYEEMRQLAAAKMRNERAGQTLQTTALVHETYLRLLGGSEEPLWENRFQFLSAAAEAMRRILIEKARSKKRLKRGGDRKRVDWPTVEEQVAEEESFDGDWRQNSVDLLALDDALRELAEVHPQKAELVKLRYFAGLTVEQAAKTLGISTSGAVRSWRYARAWLAAKMEDAAAD